MPATSAGFLPASKAGMKCSGTSFPLFLTMEGVCELVGGGTGWVSVRKGERGDSICLGT